MLTIPQVNREYIAQTGEIPNGMQLFQDSMPLKIVDTKKALCESVSGNKVPVMRCTGVFQRADEKNANGRVYPLAVLKDAIKSLSPAVKERRVMGEFDHPPDAKIHLDRISHLVTKVWMDGKTVYGEMEIINDDRCPCGNLLACYIDRNIQVGISSRGVGDMEMSLHEGEDAYIVQEGFSFVTFDAVAEPSVTGTQLKQMNESLQKKQISPKMLREMREKVLALEIRKMLLN